MNCEVYDDLVDDYVDGVRAGDGHPDERFAAFEGHLAQCPRCQALVADLDRITKAASSLDAYVPAPSLWRQIASALDARQRQPWWQHQLGALSAWVPAVAATSIVLLLAAGVWNGWRQRQDPGARQVSAPSSEAESVPADQHYEQAIASLQRLADTHNAALDPATRAVLTRNLAVIDHAITESRAALAQEPASTPAQESLLDALETKIALLQDTVALARDTGGMADDAAAAEKELNR